MLWHHTTLFMRSHALCSWHHSHYIWNGIHHMCHHNYSIDGLRPTVCMTSHPLYICHLMHSTQHHIHSLWLDTIVVITLYQLHSWHHTPYIWHHTHGSTNIISAIWPTIYNTTSTVSVSSNPGYQLYRTHSLYDITHTLRMPAYALYTTSHPLFMTSSHCSYHITSTAFMTSDTLYMRSQTCQYKHICHLTRYI